MNAIELSIFFSRMESVCGEMGVLLQRAAFSPNIKDRLDFSCAIFDASGLLCAQAAHIPVHLGSMAFAMKDIVDQFEWHAGDMVVFNDPYLGGTHLPDVTLVCPIHVDELLVGFVVNRAHHADIGSEAPGSMPLSTILEEEGLIIPPQKIISQFKKQATLEQILNQLNNSIESVGDFNAQISVNQRGCERMEALIEGYTVSAYEEALEHLNAYGDRLMLGFLEQVPGGVYVFSDVMDGDGLGTVDIKIKVALSISHTGIRVDFTGTDAQVKGNINCPLSVVAAAVYYVFRCLLPSNTPACDGVFRRIKLIAPEGCLVNSIKPAAVAAGNVETSTRLVDVVMGALAKAIPDKVPAASQGSMNNVAMGMRNDKESWNYYETIGGGMGAGAQYSGLSGVQTHMTNTLNTPIESLEMHYPLRVTRYSLRKNTGGKGLHTGGDGLCREIEFLDNAQVTVLTERRSHQPWGLQGGEAGVEGANWLNKTPMPAKASVQVALGERLLIETPGGGGWRSALNSSKL
ncbi:MAG: 5-oxoprolinase [Cycloclasticus sp. symbiont of Poecilosclerida sp. M]|nr:MAG: 5-oxoprolinase [Cycloclasticus sp. symbiont of Poecilosclerida sp. M]